MSDTWDRCAGVALVDIDESTWISPDGRGADSSRDAVQANVVQSDFRASAASFRAAHNEQLASKRP
eukprot:7894109-Prorocentrum_lima.AAC.1